MAAPRPLRFFVPALLLSLGASAGACSADVDDLFGESSGAGGGGTGGGATSTGTGVTSTSTGTTTSSSTGTTTTSSSTTSSSSTGATCGDGQIDEGEDCDGADLGGQTCASLGGSADGQLACDACAFDVSDCAIAIECGNGLVEQGEDCDDANAPGDDGCEACHFAGTGCDDAIAISMAAGEVVRVGSTEGSSADAPVGDECEGASGPERVYAITAQSRGFLTAWLPKADVAFDSVLYVRTTCENDETEVLCHDNFGGNDLGGELVSLRLAEGQTVYLFVDGFDGGEGDFELVLDLSSGEDCNDPVPLHLEGDGEVHVVGSTSSPYTSQTASKFGATTDCNGAGAGNDVAYRIVDAPVDSFTLELNPVTGYNAVLHARETCSSSETEIVCANDGFSGGVETIQLPIAQNEEPTVWVDGTAASSGGYRLILSH